MSRPRHAGGVPAGGSICEWVHSGPHQRSTLTGTLHAQASKPGDDLLFHRLGDSTIGAVWFHGRVRDGIGWVTDAMATKLWGRRKVRGLGMKSMHYLVCDSFKTVVDGGIHQARIEQLGPVSSMGYPTSTPGLSTSWSST